MFRKKSVLVLTAFSVILLANVCHQATGRLPHLAHAAVVGAVGRADGSAVHRVAVAVARFQTLAARHQTVDGRDAVGAEAARLADARVVHVCRIDITTGRRRHQKTADGGQEKDGGERGRS